jgi:hypothetical protein
VAVYQVLCSTLRDNGLLAPLASLSGGNFIGKSSGYGLVGNATSLDNDPAIFKD